MLVTRGYGRDAALSYSPASWGYGINPLGSLVAEVVFRSELVDGQVETVLPSLQAGLTMGLGLYPWYMFPEYVETGYVDEGGALIASILHRDGLGADLAPQPALAAGAEIEESLEAVPQVHADPPLYVAQGYVDPEYVGTGWGDLVAGVVLEPAVEARARLLSSLGAAPQIWLVDTYPMYVTQGYVEDGYVETDEARLEAASLPPGLSLRGDLELN
jgi:hypothetical protein